MTKLKVTEVLTRYMVREANTKLISGSVYKTSKTVVGDRTSFSKSVADAGRTAMAKAYK